MLTIALRKVFVHCWLFALVLWEMREGKRIRSHQKKTPCHSRDLNPWTLSLKTRAPTTRPRCPAKLTLALFQDPLVRRVEGSELIRHETENKLFYSELPRDRRGRYRETNGAVRVVSTVLVSCAERQWVANSLAAVQAAWVLFQSSAKAKRATFFLSWKWNIIDSWVTM